MKIEIRRSAYKDLDNIPKNAAPAIEAVILAIVSAKSISDIKNIKKLKGHKTAYRIRVGHYRIGITCDGDLVTVIRILTRKEIYRYFP